MFDAKTIAPHLAPGTSHLGGDRPTPKQIDDLVARFEEVRDVAELADENYENEKLFLIELAQRFGNVPAGAEQSIRLEGAVTILTVTTGNVLTLKEDAINDLKGAMIANKRAGLFDSMFGTRSKYELLKDAETRLRTAALPQRLVKSFTQLYARCFDVKKKSPSLKIERLGDKKPSKKKAAK